MARRRRRTVKASKRRAPKRSTRRGGTRVTARRAYSGLRRRRSNPKGILAQPSARAAMWSVGGASAEVVLNQSGLLSKQIKNRLARSAIFAALAIFIGQTMKGRIKANSIAFGIGMLAVPVGLQVKNMNLGQAFKFGNGTKAISAPVTEEIIEVEVQRRIGNPGHSYGAANAHVARVSNGGLRAL